MSDLYRAIIACPVSVFREMAELKPNCLGKTNGIPVMRFVGRTPSRECHAKAWARFIRKKLGLQV